MASPRRIDDAWARLIFNPVFAVLIPNASGVITHAWHSSRGLAASYAWFLALSTTIWEVNRRLYLAFVVPLDWIERPRRRASVLLAMIAASTIPTLVVGLAAWGWATGDPAATPRSIALATLVTILGVIIITDVYEGVFLVRTWDTERVRSERLEREKVTAELEALQREIDPHALFNQLHALVALIESNSPDATRFAETLAQAYRQMLVVRRRPLVSLDEELQLFASFRELTELRYPGAVRVIVAVTHPRDAFVPPMVLPELLQNAVKHNLATAAEPLEICIRREGDVLVVDHPRRPASASASAGVGLHNLDTRLRLTTGTGVSVDESGERFGVRVPLVTRRPEQTGQIERRQ